MAKQEDDRQLRREFRRIQRKKEERSRQLIKAGLLTVSVLIILAALLVMIKSLFFKKQVNPVDVQAPDWVKVDLLTPNEYSRPQTPLPKINGVVVHYVANPCSTARENRNFFENQMYKPKGEAQSVSSHFVIGLQGEAIQCVPLGEVAYTSNNRNADTISIECCHPDETGKFYDSTYASLVKLTAYLCREFDLKPEDVIRHYDITQKSCPKYYVDHPEEWDRFRLDLKNAIKNKDWEIGDREIAK